jgi:CspA family cold shock protein
VSERGTVKWFDARRGYGFIGRDGAVDVFVHASAVTAARELRPGDRVVFEVEEGRRGLQARQVRLEE